MTSARGAPPPSSLDSYHKFEPGFTTLSFSIYIFFQLSRTKECGLWTSGVAIYENYGLNACLKMLFVVISVLMRGLYLYIFAKRNSYLLKIFIEYHVSNVERD